MGVAEADDGLGLRLDARRGASPSLAMARGPMVHTFCFKLCGVEAASKVQIRKNSVGILRKDETK